MDKYTELKERIDFKYTGREVEQTENIISLFDLYVLLIEEMRELKDVKDLDWFKEKINNDRTFFKRFGLFRKKAIVDQKCDFVYCDIDDKKSKLSVSFTDFNTHLIVYKDIDSDELYFADHCIKDRAFVEKYISDIYGIFATLEQYGTLFPYVENKGRTDLTQSFDDGLLKVDVRCDTHGRVGFKIVPSEGIDDEGIYSRAWYSRETIASYVDEKKGQILRCIPVEISSLNEVYRNIVEEAIAKKNAHWLVKDISGMAN